MHQDEREGARRKILHDCGATAAEIEELLVYNANSFIQPDESPAYPLANEPFVEAWSEYAQEVTTAGTIEVLVQRLPQLQFPIRAGISTTEEYIAATRRGVYPRTGWKPDHRPLLAPEKCRVEMYATAAGSLPVITANCREDFIWLVQAFTRKNEPVSIPASMGACLVSGYTNWDRVRSLRSKFFEADPSGNWSAAFAAIKAMPSLYQDRFILLGRDPYSGVSAESVGVDPALWPAVSRAIRLEHECTHYFTRRVFESMRNNVLDELIADYFGICAAEGSFHADWLLHFWGLDAYPVYREGGRLQNYRGTPALSDGAFGILQHLAIRAARHLQTFDQALAGRTRDMLFKAELLSTLASFTLEEMAATNFVCSLQAALQQRMSSPAIRNASPVQLDRELQEMNQPTPGFPA